MIKECNVILHNSEIAVVKYDDVEVQVPNSKHIGKTAFIKFDNGSYYVVSKDEFDKNEKSNKVTPRKQSIDKNSVIDNEE